ncbi:MAG TPA: O-antigen ligase family protein [Candidatus Krumholzibacteria bacterium]|nr:O-antigen ligase family protein [Candidatus Krumholzibacteria bacterium]HRX51233.1 O-antigen ligase family protein [Candidatus Krumholzibacteria bacterium]
MPVAAVLLASLISFVFSWELAARFGVQALVMAVVGMVGLSVLAYVSSRDLSFSLMIWMFTMAGFRTVGMVSMPGLPDFSFDRLFLIWIMVIFAFRVVIERMRLSGPYKADFLILAHTIYVLVQLNMRDSQHVHEWVISSLSPFFAFIYGKYVIHQAREIRNILIFLILVSLYFGVTAIAEHYGITQLVWPKAILNPEAGPLWHPGRSRGPVMHPPLLGQMLGMMLLCYFVFFAKARQALARVLVFVGFGITGLGLFYAYTRGPWVATAAAFGALGVLRPNYRKVLMGFVVVGLLFSALGVYQSMNSEFLQERLDTTDTIENRLMFLATAVKMIQDYPLFGVGFFNYNHYRDDYTQGTYIPFYGFVRKHMGADMPIHDIYIGRLAEEGIVSVLLLLGFTVTVARMGLRKWRMGGVDDWFNRDVLAVFAAIMVCYHVGGMVIDYRYFDFINVIYFLVAGIIYGYRNDYYVEHESGPALAEASEG